MCSPNTGSSPKLLSYQSRSPSKWWRGSAATTPWCKARQKMGTRLKETWSSGRCSFLLATIFEIWTFGHFDILTFGHFDNPVQVLSHALDRIMLGVFCLLLLGANKHVADNKPLDLSLDLLISSSESDLPDNVRIWPSQERYSIRNSLRKMSIYPWHSYKEALP